MKPVVCLDFGSAFTKVGLRLEPDDPSRIVTEETLSFDEERFCIPTVVAANLPGRSPPWLFGMAAMDLKEEHGYRVWRNWKPLLFAAEPDAAPAPDDRLTRFLARLDEVGRREQLIRLLAERHDLDRQLVRAEADAFGLSNNELKRCVENLRMATESTNEVRAPRGGVGSEVREVARQYFAWLRAFVGRVLRRFGVESMSEVRTRLCVPAFDDSAGQRPWTDHAPLTDLLTAAGWVVHESRPVLTEPLANAIGVLTCGRNATRDSPDGRRVAHLGPMFGEGSVARTLAGRQEQSGILLVDVGAFTTDFALVEMRSAASPERCRIHARSEPGGVAELDRRIIESLPPAQSQLAGALDFRQMEAFRHTVYSRGRPCKLSAKVVVAEPQVERVQREIGLFAARLGDRLTSFLELASVPVHDLVLCGGGNNIPGVRDLFPRKLQKRGLRAIHLPDSRAKEPAGGRHPLNQKLVRGGSAIGGTSVFFDAELA